jgi:hypothetical protein
VAGETGGGAELRPGEVTETEVARIERDEQAGTTDFDLQLPETKQLMAALQDQIVPAQVAVVGERRCSCVSCGRRLASKGYYPVTFYSWFGDVPVRVRRLRTCPCQGQGGRRVSPRWILAMMRSRQSVPVSPPGMRR